MKQLALAAAASTMLGACSGVSERPSSAGREPAREPAVPAELAESLQVAKVVELRPRAGDAAPDVECDRTLMTGSRIRRTRCTVPLSDAEQRLEDEYTRSELQIAREIALIQERAHMEQALREQMQRQRR